MRYARLCTEFDIAGLYKCKFLSGSVTCVIIVMCYISCGIKRKKFRYYIESMSKSHY